MTHTLERGRPAVAVPLSVLACTNGTPLSARLAAGSPQARGIDMVAAGSAGFRDRIAARATAPAACEAHAVRERPAGTLTARNPHIPRMLRHTDIDGSTFAVPERRRGAPWIAGPATPVQRPIAKKAQNRP